MRKRDAFEWLTGPGAAIDAARLRTGPVVFLDLETTGLSGGAGTLAFLVGLGFFGDREFHTCQYVLSNVAAEPALLAAVGGILESASAIVSFNGKSFDLPVMETRWLLHRMPLPWDGTPHLDLLHPARRLWAPDRCTLAALERDLLGVTRVGDVPGSEIPSRYFGFLRGGHPSLLAPVLEHNRRDLWSLAMLTAIACRLLERGPAAAGDARQCLALGQLYERACQFADAKVCYRAVARTPAGFRTSGRRGVVKGDALRAEAWLRLAVRLRRERRHDEAVDAWERIVELRHAPSPIRREAIAALAIHHEHRSRNLSVALMFARRALEGESDPTRRHDARHRLARLGRKQAAAAAGPVRRRTRITGAAGLWDRPGGARG